MPAGAWRELANRQLERAVAAYREGEVDRDFAMWLVVKCSRGCAEPDRLRVRDRAAHALYGDGTMPPRTGKRKHLPLSLRMAVGDLVSWFASKGLPVDPNSTSGDDAISVVIAWLVDLEVYNSDNVPKPKTVHEWYLMHQRKTGAPLKPGRRPRSSR